MKLAARLALLFAAAAVATVSGVAASNTASDHASIPGVTNPAKARVDYILKCQGCHTASGKGDPRNTPPLSGEVARFLTADGGREFLARVPGVASVDLDDRRLTDVLNWTIYTFDAGHVPPDFEPYTEQEVGQLRKHPLRLERAIIRERLMAEVRQGS